MFQNLIKKYLFIIAGCSFYALAFNWCYAPNNIAYGGFTGIAQIVHTLLGFPPVGTLVFCMNVPLFLLGWKLLGPDDTAGAPREMTKVTYVVKVEGVPAELYENCVNHLPSKLMASGALVGGEIVAVDREPYYVLSADGEWILDETHTTLLFTAETETPTMEVMTTKVGDQEVRIGKTDYILKSEFIEFADGTIVDVRWGE